jgi:hypothetical protein
MGYDRAYAELGIRDGACVLGAGLRGLRERRFVRSGAWWLGLRLIDERRLRRREQRVDERRGRRRFRCQQRSHIE